MSKQIRRFYDFGKFRLDTNNHRLAGENGEIVSLTPREFVLLLALIGNAGEVVTKDALLEAVWKDAFVSEETLTRNISFLRKKLGGEQFIETLPKIGYRFTSEVRTSDVPEIIIEKQTLTRVKVEDTATISDFRFRGADVKDNLQLPQSSIQNLTLTDKKQNRKSKIENQKSLRFALGFLAVAAVGFVIYQLYARSRETKIVFTSQAKPFSALPGYETMPSFSPDSRQLAFAWNGGDGETLDLYVKIIGAGEPVRLTRGDRTAMFPVFKPDGKYIVFFRSYPEASKIYEIPALGGAERKITEAQSGGTSLSIAPDGQTIAVADRESENAATGIFLINIITGAKRRLTTAPENYYDSSPRFSPDGSQIVFIRAKNWNDQDLYVAQADAAPTDEPRRLTFDGSNLSGLAWTADGGRIVFSSKRGGSSANLWQVAAAGGNAELVMTGAKNPLTPTIAPNGKWLAYVEQAEDINIWRYEIGSEPNTPLRFAASSRAEHSPALSPDGKKLAFVSDRSGEDGIWVADADGSNLINLISAECDAPRFSPDGKRLAFAAKNAGDKNSSIFVASVEGGEPRRLTDGSARDDYPAWSADGRFLYFRSNRNGDFQIWKMPSDTSGEALQITRNGGFETFAGPDGSEIYYTKGTGVAGLWRVASDGGDEERPLPELAEAGWNRYWTLTPNGIYYLARADKPPYKIMFYDFKTRQTSEVFSNDQPPLYNYSGLDVSADGKIIFYAQHDQNASNIMLAEIGN